MLDEKEKALPDFAAWRAESLVRFAQDCTLELRRMAEENEQLREERRVAIDAYRRLMKEQVNGNT